MRASPFRDIIKVKTKHVVDVDSIKTLPLSGSMYLKLHVSLAYPGVKNTDADVDGKQYTIKITQCDYAGHIICIYSQQTRKLSCAIS